MADTQEVKDLKQQIQEINDKLKTVGGLGIDMAEAFRKAGDNTDKLKKYLDEVKKRLSEITDETDYIYQTFKSIGSELTNQNTLLSTGKKSFQSLTSIAQNLNYYQKGNTDLSEKQFKSIKNSIGLHEKELLYTKRQLELSIQANKKDAESLQNRLYNGEKLNTQEKNIIKNYEKEVALLNNIGYTIENNIVSKLKSELKISKEISDVRRDIGGIAVSTAKVLSTYAGPLASFLNVNSAIEAVDDFSKRQIERALSSKTVQDELLAIEQKKFEIQKAAAVEIDKINKKNISQADKDKQISAVNAKESKDIIKQENESVRVRREAIKSTDNLGNRFKALGIAMKELGTGLIKALTDPVTIIGLIIKLFNRAVEGAKNVSQRVTDVSRALGVSAGLGGKLAGNMIASAQSAGGIFISAKKAVAAIQQLTDSLGIAVQFSGEEIALQAQLTELVGLSADEAARFNKISALSGKSTEKFVRDVQKGAMASMRTNKVHLSDKQVLQEVSKLSAGILVKFQGNPKALGDAVVQAKKLGLSLDKLEGVSESLLDFQSSIENELQAELLTGRQLNLEKARYAALTGNQADLMKAIAEEAGSAEEFTKLNVIAQKSLAQAFGMSRDEMSEMLLQQEMVNKYGDKAATLNAQELKDLERSGLSLDQYLKKQTTQLSLQERMTASQERLAETIDNKLAPLGNTLANIFLNLQKLLIIVIDELLGEAVGPIDDIAKKIQEWTENSSKFREKIREWKKEFKENLNLIKNIAIAIGAIFVVSKALAFFSVLRLGFKGLMPLVSGLGKGISKVFTKAPKTTTSITRGGKGVTITKNITPKPAVKPIVSPSAAKGFTLKSGKSFLQGGKAYSVKTGGALQGAAKTSVIKAAAKQVFFDPKAVVQSLKNFGSSIKTSAIDAGKSISTGATNTLKAIRNLPKTVGTGLTNAKDALGKGATNTLKAVKGLPSAIGKGAVNVSQNVAIRGITAASRAKEALKTGVKGFKAAPVTSLKSGISSGAKLLASPVKTLGKAVLKGGASGLLSGLFGGIEGFMDKRTKLIDEKLKKDSAAIEAGKQLKAGTISQEQYDEQIATRKKELGKGTTGQAAGAGALQGVTAALGAGLGSALGPVGTMIGGYLGNSVGKWINEKAPGVSERFGKVWDSVSSKFTSALEPWKKVIENIKEGFDKAREVVDGLLKNIGIDGGLSSVMSHLAEIVGETLMYPIKLVMGALGGVADLFKALGQLLTGDFKGAWETVKNGFLDLMKVVFSPFLFIFDKIKLGWLKIKNILPSWLGGDDKSAEAAASAPKPKTQPTQTQPTNPQPKKMATGGVVTRSGVAEVDQGEVYLGRNTKDSFSLMVAASQRQLNALMVLEKALVDVKNEVKNMSNKPPASVVLELDGRQVTRQISSRPEMQQGLGKSRVMLA
jgi:hypothetical protein